MTKMSTFHYKGLNPWGQKITHDLDAESLAQAKVELHKQGIRILRITKKRKSFFNRANKKISPRDISYLSRQLATLLEAGIPLLQALDIVSKSQSHRNLNRFIQNIKQDIHTGLSLSEALSKHPLYFNPLSCKLVHIGEQSGSLDVMLDKVALYQAKLVQVKKTIKKASTYPLSILIISLIVTLVLLEMVVPQFEILFKGFGADLPWITRKVLKTSQWICQEGYLMMSFIILGFCSFFRIKKKSSSVSKKMDAFLIKMPILGAILKKLAIARFADTLSLTLAAGLPLVDALQAISAATGYRLYTQATDEIRQEISSGLPMHAALEKTNLFPPMVIQMVRIGEESGTLDRMLNKIAVYYEDQVGDAMEVASQLLEPLIMCILGILVGGLVISMYLPIFKLGSII